MFWCYVCKSCVPTVWHDRIERGDFRECLLTPAIGHNPIRRCDVCKRRRWRPFGFFSGYAIDPDGKYAPLESPEDE